MSNSSSDKHVKAVNSRRLGSTNRWLDVAMLALGGGLIGWAIASLKFPVPDWFGRNIHNLTTGWLGFSLMTYLWAVVLSVGGLCTALSYRKRQWRYPSVGAAVLVVVFIMALHQIRACSEIPFLPSLYTESFWLGCPQLLAIAWSAIMPLGALVVGIGLKDVYVYWQGSKKKNSAGFEPKGNEQTPSLRDPDLPEDLQWILEEEPAETLERHDRFRRGPLVKRLVRILEEINEQRTIGTIGLIGPYGSGKSTISRFVRAEMRKTREDVLFVSVPGWGVQDIGLTKYVLECIMEVLETQGCDCLAMRGLPKQYLDAIGVINNKAGKFFNVACAPLQSPEEVLSRLVPLLGALGLSLVLCIEDVERGGSSESLQELAAMLDRFRRMPFITFIVEANVNASEHLDLSRICDHVERVPSLPAQETWDWLRKLRNACADYARKKNDILPAEEAIDQLSHPEMPYEDVFWSPLDNIDYAFSEQPRSAVRLTVARGAGTPRIFKHALRRIWLSWKSLHGEVDLRELILLNILRDAAPEAFDFVVRNIEQLRGIAFDRDTEHRRSHQKELMETWKKLVIENDWGEEAASAILRAIDINFFDDYPDVYARRHAAQSIHQPLTQNDYLQRILAGEIDDA